MVSPLVSLLFQEVLYDRPPLDRLLFSEKIIVVLASVISQ